MKNHIHSSTDEDVLAEQGPFKLTYEEFLHMAKERRLAELEQSNPGEAKRNANNAGNTTRAIRAFMKANNLRNNDLIGKEMLDQTAWEKARDKLGPAKGSERSLSGKARIWALEAFRAQETRYADESFSARFTRLRAIQGLTFKELASRVSTSSDSTDRYVLQKWGSGDRRPDPKKLSTVERLEKALKAPPGSLVEKMPKVPWRARSVDLDDLPASRRRRLIQHLPSDFESRSNDKGGEEHPFDAEGNLRGWRRLG